MHEGKWPNRKKSEESSGTHGPRGQRIRKGKKEAREPWIVGAGDKRESQGQVGEVVPKETQS
jgi:hypothetical protein